MENNDLEIMPHEYTFCKRCSKLIPINVPHSTMKARAYKIVYRKEFCFPCFSFLLSELGIADDQYQVMVTTEDREPQDEKR